MTAPREEGPWGTGVSVLVLVLVIEIVGLARVFDYDHEHEHENQQKHLTGFPISHGSQLMHSEQPGPLTPDPSPPKFAATEHR